MVNKIKN